jgi:hypothetical protein
MFFLPPLFQLIRQVFCFLPVSVLYKWYSRGGQNVSVYENSPFLFRLSRMYGDFVALNISPSVLLKTRKSCASSGFLQNACRETHRQYGKRNLHQSKRKAEKFVVTYHLLYAVQMFDSRIHQFSVQFMH